MRQEMLSGATTLVCAVLTGMWRNWDAKVADEDFRVLTAKEGVEWSLD